MAEEITDVKGPDRSRILMSMKIWMQHLKGCQVRLRAGFLLGIPPGCRLNFSKYNVVLNISLTCN